ARRVHDPDAALRRIDDALDLWRGEPYPELSDVDEARQESARLAELRVRAREERADAVLAAGRPLDAVADLTALVSEQPLRRRPRALLMAALAGTGRVADALRVYDDFRRTLADELGIEPSVGLSRQHLALLDGSAPEGPPARRPSRLPVPPTSLIGRADLVET